MDYHDLNFCSLCSTFLELRVYDNTDDFFDERKRSSSSPPMLPIYLVYPFAGFLVCCCLLIIGPRLYERYSHRFHQSNAFPQSQVPRQQLPQPIAIQPQYQMVQYSEKVSILLLCLHDYRLGAFDCHYSTQYLSWKCNNDSKVKWYASSFHSSCKSSSQWGLSSLYIGCLLSARVFCNNLVESMLLSYE